MNGIQLEQSFDIQIRVERDASGRIAGGLVVGDILAQNQALIINAHKGEFKESPIVGVGISDMLLDHDALAWRTEIREQLEIDGQTVDDVKITTSEITVDAHY